LKRRSLPCHPCAAGRLKPLSHGITGPDSFSEGAAAAGKKKTPPAPLFACARGFAFLPSASREEAEPALMGQPKASNEASPFALPDPENAAQLPYSRVIGYHFCIILDRIKREKRKVGKRRKILPASEIIRKVTFLMLTHTKCAQPLVSADHMLPLLLARS